MSSSSSSSSTTSILQSKLTSNLTAHLPAQAEEVPKTDYEDESAYQNEDIHDDETTNHEESQIFGDPMSGNRPAIKPSNTKKDSDLSSTSRIPFVPSNLWRDLFSKPGILVGKFIFFLKEIQKSFFFQVLSVELSLECYPLFYL